MAFIWGMFLVAKVHFFKFKEYSKYIYPATKFVMLSLVILTILGGIFIFNISSNTKTIKTVEETATNDVY
ncbi:MAG: hypothetical protein PHZ26_00690 [Candidatus Gracilibacteria bacterium]|nr:hypothetical protein [Candidatus Gracilibacteria bacterium]MDD2908253.1 hypothetical protein [Candidatus Gracilibacteria bacterium]